MALLCGCAAGTIVRPSAAADLSWTVTPAGVEEDGLKALSGGDGVTTFVEKGGSRALTTQDGTDPASHYLYFQCTGAIPAGRTYVEVEYFDSAPGTANQCEYDSDAGDDIPARYQAAESEAGGFALGTAKWRKAIFLLEKPLFKHRENLGADFRFAGPRMCLRSVRAAASKPADWDQVDRITAVDLKPLVKIGPKGQLIVGGFDPAHAGDAPHLTHALASAAPAMKQLGVTSHEGYVRWNLCEPQEGQYDWSVYDQYVKVYRASHLKWVPFLIVGSPYSLPDWYYKKPGSQGYVCLEHGLETDVQSLWNPVLRRHVARFIQAFCEHYRDTGVIESILLGVTGNYGEAIYPATGSDWTGDIHGPYHSHPGYWAGDPFAIASFREWLQRKYGDPGRLSAAWGKSVGGFGDIKPFLRKDAPNDRAWLDFVTWYIDSMTDWATFWLRETRRNFPKGDIYLCTGGHAPPEHGSDFGDQCKAAASVGGGVRITNEGSDYRGNFSLTRWVASAGEQYGAYYSFEPAGNVNPNGVIARIYNATASGARGLHYYYPNLFDTETARDNFIQWGAVFQQRKPVTEIAVYYPETFIRLNGNDFLRMVQPLRDDFDFDYMSDGQIANGGLKRIKALLLIHGNVAEASTWSSIEQWVRNGGLLVYADGAGRLRTVEGDERVNDRLFGGQAKPGKGRVVEFHGDGDSREFRQLAAQTLAAAPEISADTRVMVAADGQEDNVFVTLCQPHELLWLNYTDQPVTKAGHVLPPFGIVSYPAGR